MQRRTRTVNGVPMGWEEQGEGLPVVLVHGIPTGPALWRHVTPHLTDVRVLAVEMVGYAASIPPGRTHPIGVADQAGHLLNLLDDLDIDRAVLVGHDLGGGVVQIAAVRQPDRCAGLVVTNGIAYDSWPVPSVKALAAASPIVSRLPDVLVKPVIATLMARGHDDAATARESLAVHWAHYAAHDGAAALARQARSLDVTDTLAVADRLPDLDVPAAVVWGAADQFQKVEYGRRLAEDLGTALRRIEGGRHFTPEDHPDDVSDAIRDVLART